MPRANLFIISLLLFISTAHANTYLKEVVTYLASDQLEGRKPGQNGNLLATKYLEDEMAEIIIRASISQGDTISVGFDKKNQKLLMRILSNKKELSN